MGNNNFPKKGLSRFFSFLCLIVLCAFSQKSSAQSSSNYTFSTNNNGSLGMDMNNNVVDMTSGSLQLIGPGLDSILSPQTNIGFDFYFMGAYMNSFSCTENGLIELGGHSLAANYYHPSSDSTGYLLAPFAQNLQVGYDGEVRYKLFGNAPNRVLVIEYLNVIISSNSNNVTAGTATFQVRLYETTGIFEYIYGQAAANNSVQNDSVVQIGWLDTIASNKFMSIDSLNNSTTSGVFSQFIAQPVSIIPHLHSLTDGSRRYYRFTPVQLPVVSPTGLTFSPVSASAITINWTDNSTNETNFNVFKSTDNINFTKISTIKSNSTGTIGTGYNFTVTGLLSNFIYYFRIVANSEAIPSAPLSGSRQTTLPIAYHWTGIGNSFFSDPASWNPQRTTADPTDTLYFDNGVFSSPGYITNINAAKIVVTNNTTVSLASASGATITITAKVQNALQITQGSALLLISPFPKNLTLTFSSGFGAAASIGGTLEIGTNNIYNTTNSSTTVSGTLANSGTITGASTSNLIFSGTGTYNHKYTISVGSIPTASWNTGSTCLISGYTTNTTNLVTLYGQTLSNLTWNCPAQFSIISLQGNFPLAINGTLKIISGLLRLSTNSSTILNVNNFSQTGGTFEIDNGVGTTTMKVSGTFNQSGGIFAPNINGSPTLEFNGSSGIQNVNFNNAAPVGALNYKISNPFGINLSGSGTLTTNFNINANSSIRISTAAITPINTSLHIVYNNIGSLLTYDAPAERSMTAVEFPSVFGPSNVGINMPGLVLTMPFSRMINGTLYMNGGDIDIGANSITIGISSTTVGSLSWVSGNIRVTSGSMTRWFSTANLPLNPGTISGYFPLASGTDNRNVSVYGSSQFSTGGSLTISHTNIPGITTGLSAADGSYIVQRRTNSYWTFASQGLVSNGSTLGIRITGGNLVSSSNISKLRLMQSASFIGVYVPGSGTSPNLRVERIGLNTANLSTSFYIGAADVDLDPYYVAINSGNWSDPSIWSSSAVPAINNNTVIATGVSVVIDNNSQCKSLTINQGGTLTASANSLTIDNTVLSYGSLNISGGDISIVGGALPTQGLTTSSGSQLTISSGSLSIGPAGGGNKRWTHLGGIANINGGTININGNILISGGNFNQSNGNIIIDGNSGISASTSVPNGSSLFQYTGGTLSCSAGLITIVDPPYSSTVNSLAVSLKSSSTNITSFTGTHTFVFGNGISNTNGNPNNGFIIDTYTPTNSGRIPLNNVIVNSGNSAGRFVRNTLSTSNGTHIQGTLTINSNSEYRVVTNTINRDCFGGNIINNGKFTSLWTITLGGETGIYAINIPQTISGSGIFQNQIAGGSAYFTGLTLNNSGGITMLIGNASYSGVLTFTAGNLNIGSNTLIQIAGGNTAGNPGTFSHIIGKFQQHVSTGLFTLNFPIGDASAYTPINITGGAGSITNPGDIIAGTKAIEHPNISSSGISSARDINRYYSLQSINGITLFPNSITITLNWTLGDIDINANTNNFYAALFDGNSWSLTQIKSRTNFSIRPFNLSSLGEFAVGELCQASADFNYNGSPFCSSGNAAPAFNGGGTAGTFSEPTGLVSLNVNTGVINLSTSTAGTYVITNTVNSPGCPPVIDTAKITIISTPAASIIIAASANPACAGIPITFTATPVNGGIPSFQWKLNGNNVGTNSAVYTSSTITNGSTITCTLNSSLTCVTGNNAPSNIITMTVNPLPPTPSIISLGSTLVSCSGSDTLVSSQPGPGNLWSPGGLTSDTVVTTSGSYTLVYTDTNGCSSHQSTPVIVTLITNPGPLNGNYTIGSGPLTCTNFNSFESAIDALNTKGISGNVVFNIQSGFKETAPGTGLQLKMCALAASIQSNASRTITFQKSGSGINPIIFGGIGNSNIDAIVKIIGTDYVTFDHIDLADTSVNSNGLSQIEWGYALLKCDGTNGAMHNTIKNCNISMQNNNSTVGIYLNNHTESSNIALTYTGSAGADSAFRSSNNLFYGDTILNAYTGISLTGSSFYNDTLNEIGRIGFSPNRISDFGGGTVAASGINVSDQHQINILNNIISGGDSSTGIVSGINVSGLTGFSGVISDNTISVNSAATTSNGLNGINVSYVTNGDNLKISGNIIQGCNFRVGTSAPFTGIFSTFSGNGTETISGNIIRNIDLTTSLSGSFTGISIGASPAVLNLKSNLISGNNLSGVGAFYGISLNDSIITLTADSNSITENRKTGTFGTMNFLFQNSTAEHSITRNIITGNGLAYSSGAISSSIFGINDQSGKSAELISGNIISKLFIDGANSGLNSITGIRCTNNSTGRVIQNNKIDSLYSQNSTTIIGISSNIAAGAVSIAGNKISNLAGGGISSSIIGIVNTNNPASVTISNNLIGNLYAPTASGSTAVRGMDLSGSTVINIYYNTIRLDAVSTNSTFGSSGLFVNVFSTVNMRNNIIVNLSVPGGTGGLDGVTAAYRRNSSGFSNYSLLSNNNLFYAGVPGDNNLIYCEGAANPVSNPIQTLAAYKSLPSLSPRDSASVTENVPFLSTNGLDNNFLHIDTAILTYTEGNGRPIAGFSLDYDGDSRNIFNPDIGADEGGFTGVGPSISQVTPIPGTGQCTAAGHTINAVIIPGLNPIDSVILNYSFNGIAQGSVIMLNSTGNTWTSAIPAATPANALVNWSIKAADDFFSQTLSGNYQDEILTLNTFTINASSTPGFVCGQGTTQLNAIVKGTGIPPNNYCTPVHTGSTNCIYQVLLNTLNNNSSQPGGCALPAYTLYPQSGLTTTSLTAGNTYPLTVTNSIKSMVILWIDYNRNGTFENTEGTLVYPSSITGTINITIPSTASIGGTRMRLRSTTSNGTLLFSDACLTMNTGETEDYIINIISPFNYLWSPTTGLSNSNIANPLAAISAATTYTVTASDNYGCTLPSLITAAGITIAAPPSPPLGINSTQCGSGIPGCSVISSTGFLKWYLSSTAGNAIPGENGTSITSHPINSTTHYWVAEFNGTCESARTEVIAFVNQPDPITASSLPAIVCSLKPITLSAAHPSTANNYTYSWTASPASGSGIPGSINGQSIIITPASPGTYIYTVTATDINLNCHTVSTVSVTVLSLPLITSVSSSSSQVCPGSSVILSAYSSLDGTASVGADTLHNSKTDGWPTPYGGYYGGTRCQYLVRASELIAAGLNQGEIKSLAFIINQLSSVQTFFGFSIKLGNTAANSLSTNFETTPLTQVYGPINYSPVTGINNHIFSAPFIWNGVSNLLIEICFNNNTNVNQTGNVVCSSSSTSYISSIHYGANLNSTVCFNAASSGQEMKRPNLILGGTVYSSGAGLLNWTWNPGNLPGNIVNAVPQGNTIYTVTANFNVTSCSNSSTLSISTGAVPVPPAAHDSSHCGLGIPKCKVNGIGNIFHWYLAPSGGSYIPSDSGSVLSTYFIAATTTFYVSEYNGNCESARTPVIETVFHPDSVAAVISSGPYCIGSLVTLSAVKYGTANSYNYTWTASPSIGSGINFPASGAAVNIIPDSTGNFEYNVTAVDGNCAASSKVAITVNAIPKISSTNAEPPIVCSGSPVSLSAKSFDVTGNSAAIGTGTVQNTTGTYPTPYGHSFGGAKEQYLILASELNAAGLQPGIISSISFNALSLPVNGGNVLQSFSVSMGHTNISSLPPQIQNGISGMTQLMFIPTYSILPGINTHNFTNPFNWDGVSNLLIEVCFNNNDNGGGSGGNAVVAQSATSFVSTIEYHRSNTSNLCTNQGTASISSFFQRPNIILGGTIGNDLTATLSWKWNPGNIIGSTVSAISTTPGINIYTVTAANSFGCTTSNTASFFVNGLSPAPISHDSIHCGNTVPLCYVDGSGGFSSWYLTPTGGVPLAGETGTTLSNYTIGTTTTFYVAEFDGICESARTPVTEIVTPSDSVYVSASTNTICQGNTITLTAGQNGTSNNYSYSWSSSAGGGLNTFNGNQVTANPSISGGITYTSTAFDAAAGCTWITPTIIHSDLAPSVSVLPANDSICFGSQSALTANVNLSGSAMQFNGIDQYVSIPSSSSLDLTSDFTLEAWVNPAIISSGDGIISKNQLFSNGSYFIRLGSAAPFTGIDAGGNSQITAPSGLLNPGEWSHLAVVFSNLSGNNNYVTIYINGNAVATGISNVIVNTDSLRIGLDFGGNFFGGIVDEIRIWNTPLSQAIIQSWMKRPMNNSHPAYSHLKAYFDFNFSSGSILSDLSGNGNNGHINNFAVTIPSTAPLNGGFSYSWSPPNFFNDPTISNPIVTPPLPGNNNFVVISTASNGCSSSASSSIFNLSSHQTPSITPQFSPVLICNSGSETLTLQNPRKGAGIQWQSSNNNINWVNISGADSTILPTGILTTTTYFRVLVNCSVTDTSNVVTCTVNNPSIVSTSGGTRCGPGIITISATGNGTIQWYQNSTGGNPLFTGSVFQPLVASTTTYWAEARIGGCSFSGSRQPVLAVVTSGPPVSASATPTIICEGVSTTLHASSINDPNYSYQWNPTGLTGANISINPIVTTIYTVTATDTTAGSNSGCISSNVITISVNPLPPIPVVNSSSPGICSIGGAVTLSISNIAPSTTYRWNPGNHIGNTFTVSPASTTTYTVSAIRSTGCITSSLYTVIYSPIAAPVISFGGSSSICQGESITLSTGNYSTYVWSNSSGIVSTSQTFTTIPSISTTYTVTVSNGLCSSSSSQAINVRPFTHPVISTSNNTTVFCQGSSIILNGGTGYNNYSWFNGNTNVGIGQSYTAFTSGTYSVAVTSLNNCSGTASIIISSNPSPASPFITTQGPINLCLNGSNSPVILMSDTTGAGSGAIMFWNDLNATTANTLTVNYDDLDLTINGNTYDYFFTVTNNYGCENISNLITVNVNSCNGNVNLDTKLFIEGYYMVGSPNLMDNYGIGGCLYVTGLSSNQLDADAVYVSAVHPITLAVVDTKIGTLKTNGHVNVTFGNAVTQGSSYYIKIKHRNALETWSANPIMMNLNTTYDFTTSQTKAYGSNQTLTVDALHWAFYSGDISDAATGLAGHQDGVVESQDYSDIENALFIIATGYIPEDITGDGVVESMDYSIMENNLLYVIHTIHP